MNGMRRKIAGKTPAEIREMSRDAMKEPVTHDDFLQARWEGGEGGGGGPSHARRLPAGATGGGEGGGRHARGLPAGARGCEWRGTTQ